MFQTLLFYMFSTILVMSAAMVVSGRNPVHSVLFLILGFFNAAALFLIAGAELLAMILVIVYVGAVAVLFLFVVMMLDINFRDLRKGMAKYGMIGGLVGLVFAAELVMTGFAWVASPRAEHLVAHPITSQATTNAHALGELLYTHYFYIFQLSGMVLLVAMIGAIVLTLRQRKGALKQDIYRQYERDPSNTLEVKKVPFRKGVGKIS